MTDHRPRLVAMLNRGCFLPSVRDHASLMLEQAERRAFERSRAGYCASGCTAPVVTMSPEPLCGDCAAEMVGTAMRDADNCGDCREEMQ